MTRDGDGGHKTTAQIKTRMENGPMTVHRISISYGASLISASIAYSETVETVAAAATAITVLT